MDVVRMKYIQEQILHLPSGNITYKTINGKRYPYYQWTENGKQHSRVVKAEEFEQLSGKIEERKNLQKKLKESEGITAKPVVLNDDFFFSIIKRGKELLDFVAPVRPLKKENVTPNFTIMFMVTVQTGYLFYMVCAEPGRRR